MKWAAACLDDMAGGMAEGGHGCLWSPHDPEEVIEAIDRFVSSARAVLAQEDD